MLDVIFLSYNEPFADANFEHLLQFAPHAKRVSGVKGILNAHKAAAEKWKQRNRVKRAAHVILGNAVRSGKIVPQPCWVCGEKAEAHHPDYDQPLSVVWLCPSHHKQTHALTRKP